MCLGVPERPHVLSGAFWGPFNVSGDALMMLGKLKGVAHVLAAAKHNKRTMYVAGIVASAIDASLSHLNYALAGPNTPGEIVKLWNQLRAGAGITKPGRKDEVSAIEVVFSLAAGTEIDLKRYFTDCTTWAMKQFGGEANILASDVHMDEASPHCHVLMLPLVGQRMNGSDLIGGRAKLRALQAGFHADVASRYGLARPPPRLSGTARRMGAKQVHDILRALPNDAQRWASIIAALHSCIDRDPRPFMDDLGIAPPVRPHKTFKQIALSTGAGPKTEAGEASRDARLCIGVGLEQWNPIGRGGVPDERTLSCVGFRQSSPSPAGGPGGHPRATTGLC